MSYTHIVSVYRLKLLKAGRKFIVLLTLLLCVIINQAGAQSSLCPPNIDFELGDFSSWQDSIGTCCPLVTPTAVTAPAAPRFLLTSGTTNDACCSFPVVGAGVYSLRIGSTATNYLAEKATYYVHVPATVTNYILVYRYAFVMQDPGHTAASQPRFWWRQVTLPPVQ